MKQLIKKILQTALIVPMLVLGASAVVSLQPSVVSAQTCDPENLNLGSGAECAAGDGQEDNLFSAGGIFQTVTNILLFLIGAIAVIMLVIGGIRYVVSGGDQAAVTGAKNTILYAIVGIVVAFLAYAAVQFVIGALGNSGSA